MIKVIAIDDIDHPKEEYDNVTYHSIKGIRFLKSAVSTLHYDKVSFKLSNQ